VLFAGFAITGTLFLMCAVGNAAMPFLARRTGRSQSMVPLVGGISGVVAALLCPWSVPTSVIPLPLLLDLGTGPMVFGAIWHAARTR
jgi:hypothetical protein